MQITNYKNINLLEINVFWAEDECINHRRNQRKSSWYLISFGLTSQFLIYFGKALSVIERFAIIRRQLRHLIVFKRRKKGTSFIFESPKFYYY